MYLPGRLGYHTVWRLFPSLMQVGITCMKGKRRYARIRSQRNLHASEYYGVLGLNHVGVYLFQKYM